MKAPHGILVAVPPTSGGAWYLSLKSRVGAISNWVWAAASISHCGVVLLRRGTCLAGPPPCRADHTRVKQRTFMAYRQKGACSVKRVFYLLNMDTQDRQDERLLLRKLTGSMIGSAFVGNLSVLRGPSRTPLESFPTPWIPFPDSSLAPLTDPLAPLVEISSPFPTFGGSLLSFLQPLSGPSSSFVALRGFLFLARGIGPSGGAAGAEPCGNMSDFRGNSTHNHALSESPHRGPCPL